MSLIIYPKTTKKVVQVFREVFDSRKVPVSVCKFWHGNFKDQFYKGLDGMVYVLFTGYSGGTVGQAILEYVYHYVDEDDCPEVYFVGSVYAFRDSELDVGDLVYTTDTFSPLDIIKSSITGK